MNPHRSFRPHTTRITPDTYIRALPYSMLERIARQLDPYGTSTTWRDLALKVPISSINPTPRFTNNDIQHFEMCSRQGKSPTMNVLASWATTNATAKDLINVFHAMNLPKLADMILPREGAVDYIHPGPHGQGQPPSYQVAMGLVPPSFVPSTHELDRKENLNTSTPSVSQSLPLGGRRRGPVEHDSISYRHPSECAEPVTNVSEQLSLEDLSLERNLPSFSYSDLSELTANFNDSCKLGEGAFGSVFSGHLHDKPVDSNRKIAIKRLKLDAPDLAVAVTQQFKKEIHLISDLKHDNILPLVGYSCDGPELCLVYDFMFNGSLSSNLQGCRDGTNVLLVSQRIQIAEGSAAGIEYLHGRKLVHRDIKSSNILLDMESRPRISDFGLIRSVTSSATMTTKPIGTPMYMAPEAYRGEVSPAMDVYGFGIVLLELITSRTVHDEDRDPPSLESYVTEKCEEDEKAIMDLVDKEAGTWNEQLALDMYHLIISCFAYRPKKRPKMTKVHETIKTLLSS